MGRSPALTASPANGLVRTDRQTLLLGKKWQPSCWADSPPAMGTLEGAVCGHVCRRRSYTDGGTLHSPAYTPRIRRPPTMPQAPRPPYRSKPAGSCAPRAYGPTGKPSTSQVLYANKYQVTKRTGPGAGGSFFPNSLRWGQHRGTPGGLWDACQWAFLPPTQLPPSCRPGQAGRSEQILGTVSVVRGA